MSIARHHTEWLSLVPVSGPFLSLPVRLEAFSAGLEPHDPDHVRLLRQEYEEWRVMGDGGRVIPRDRHNAFIRFILQETLDLPDNLLLQGQSIPQTLQVEIPEHGELLRPDFVLASPPSGNASPATNHAPRLLIQTYSRSQDLSSYVSGSTWKASPDTRMTELLHGTGVRLGLVTNGEHWMLVDAPKGETSGYASWYGSLWLDEPITLRAFRSLLSVQRFFGVPDDQTLESLLAKSASNQQEVTDQLGYQVRKAVEVLIHSLDKADQDFGRELLADVTSEQLYESALTVMMRLVFLFCAEERELIPSKPFPVYEQNYSVCTISRQLRELADQHGEELLERRYDAWQRLLAAFRAVYGGLKHDDVQIPAYGGSLFNPNRFPFLEGRKRGTCWRD
ncbi:MAG: type IIL restriction-modification enzyme MmeI, partial [Planctomyces sp.]